MCNMFSKNKKSSKKFKKEDDIQNNRIEMNIQNAVESKNCDEKVLKEVSLFKKNLRHINLINIEKIKLTIVTQLK